MSDHDAHVDALRAVAQAATPGPWGWRGHDDGLVELRGPGHFGPYDARLISAHAAEPCFAEILDGDSELDALSPMTTGAPTPYICDSCKAMWRAYQAGDGDAFDGYRCPKPENTPTVWVNEPGHGHIVPINRFVHRQREHRPDIDPAVDHPNARFIAAANPATVLALLDELDRLRAQVLPPWTCHDGNGRRYQAVHPDTVDARPLDTPLADVPLHVRLLPFGVDSAGNVVAGEGGGAT